MFIEEALQAWEGEGGTFRSTERRLIGTVNQVEWALQIQAGVNAEFDRVAQVLKSVASKQSEPDRRNTQAIIAILERKRADVMAKDHAGYFIRDWQEITDQVRRMIVQDSDYQALQTQRGGNSMEMKIVDAFAKNARLQTTESNPMRSVQNQLLDNLVQAPLSIEGRDQLLAILDKSERAKSSGELVIGSQRSANEQPGDAAKEDTDDSS